MRFGTLVVLAPLGAAGSIWSDSPAEFGARTAVGHFAGFGIARSAPVGGSARRALPPPRGADPGFWGERFF